MCVCVCVCVCVGWCSTSIQCLTKFSSPHYTLSAAGGVLHVGVAILYFVASRKLRALVGRKNKSVRAVGVLARKIAIASTLSVFVSIGFVLISGSLSADPYGWVRRCHTNLLLPQVILPHVPCCNSAPHTTVVWCYYFRKYLFTHAYICSHSCHSPTPRFTSGPRGHGASRLW